MSVGVGAANKSGLVRRSSIVGSRGNGGSSIGLCCKRTGGAGARRGRTDGLIVENGREPRGSRADRLGFGTTGWSLRATGWMRQTVWFKVVAVRRTCTFCCCLRSALRRKREWNGCRKFGNDRFASQPSSMGEKVEFVACVVRAARAAEAAAARFSNGVRRRWAARERRGARDEGRGAREEGRVYIIIMSERAREVEVLKRALSLCTTRLFSP